MSSDKREYWQGVISDWKVSKLSQPAFCKKHNIVYSQFCYWRYVFNKEMKRQAGHFVPVTLNKDKTTTATSLLNICLPEGVTVKVSDESQLLLVAKLIKALR